MARRFRRSGRSRRQRRGGTRDDPRPLRRARRRVVGSSGARAQGSVCRTVRPPSRPAGTGRCAGARTAAARVADVGAGGRSRSIGDGRAGRAVSRTQSPCSTGGRSTTTSGCAGRRCSPLLVALRQGGGDFERFGRYADAMLEEREFFIRKAIGWVLRDTGRKRPELVFEWLLPRAAAGVRRDVPRGTRAAVARPNVPPSTLAR